MSLPWVFGLLTLLYFQDRMYFGGVSLSLIWRLTLYLLIILILLQEKKLGFKRWQLLLIVYLLYYPLGTQSGFSAIVLDNFSYGLPILAGYFVVKFVQKYTRYSGFIFLHILCVFLILTSIPFLVGAFEVNDTSTIDQYQITRKFNSDLRIFVGFFKHPNLAGKAISFATAFILFSLLSENYRVPLPKWIQILVLVLGIYVLYTCFVRASWVAFLFIILFGIYRVQYTRKFLLFFVLMSFIFFYALDWIVIYNRLLGISSVNVEFDITNVSSGRTDIWSWIIVYLLDQGGFSIFVGLGGGGYLNAFGNTYAHNLFVQLFAHSGIVGLFLAFVVIVFFVADLRNNSCDSGFTKFAYSLLGAFFIFAITSHGLDYWSGFILGGVLFLATTKGSQTISPAITR